MTENHQIIKILILILVAVAISTSILSLIKYYYGNEVDPDYHVVKNYYESVANKPHKIFLLGTSHLHPLVPYPMEEYLKSNHQDYQIYNLGTAADNPEKRLRYLDLIIAAKPDIVVYGISPLDFDHIQLGDLQQEGLPDLSQIFHGISSSILDKLNISIFDPGFVPKLVVLKAITSGRIINSVPDEPQNLVISNVTSTSFTATWQPPSSWGPGKILGYDIKYGVNGSPSSIVDTAISTTTKTYGGFPSGSTILFEIMALTSTGNGVPDQTMIFLPNSTTTGSTQPSYYKDWSTKVRFFPLDGYALNYTGAASDIQLENDRHHADPKGTILAPPDKNEKEIALNEIIEKLKENHIKVIIFTDPLHKSYWDLIPKDEEKSFDLILKDVSEKNDLKIYSLDHKYSELHIWGDNDHIIPVVGNLTEYEKDVCNIIISEVKS